MADQFHCSNSEQNFQQEKDYYIYLVKFSTDRIKVGITSSINKRLKYYKQEAARHGMSIDCIEYHLIMGDKEAALALEKQICKDYRRASVKNHREWFKGDSSLYHYISGRIHQLTIIEFNEFIRDDGYKPGDATKDLLAVNFSYAAYIGLFGGGK